MPCFVSGEYLLLDLEAVFFGDAGEDGVQLRDALVVLRSALAALEVADHELQLAVAHLQVESDCAFRGSPETPEVHFAEGLLLEVSLVQVREDAEEERPVDLEADDAVGQVDLF